MHGIIIEKRNDPKCRENKTDDYEKAKKNIITGIKSFCQSWCNNEIINEKLKRLNNKFVIVLIVLRLAAMLPLSVKGTMFKYLLIS